MAKFYTGIGSRGTPEEMLALMTELAARLERLGWTLRSGGADGADLAFENGVNKLKEVYLPWWKFNDSDSPLNTVCEGAMQIASENHGNWKWMKENKPSWCKLMARNVYQVQGKTLDSYSSFVVCWTPDGCEHDETRTKKTGGTGLAISVASKLGIPVFNLANETSFKRIIGFFREDEEALQRVAKIFKKDTEHLDMIFNVLSDDEGLLSRTKEALAD